MNHSSHEENKRHAFDCFCKKVLRNETRDYYDEVNRRQNRETTLSDLKLPEQIMNGSAVIDEHPSDYWTFSTVGFTVLVKVETIAKAISSLSNEKRAIVLLAYFLDMTDKEIGKKLNLSRRTVQKMRTSSLKALKRYLGGYSNEKAID